MSKNAAKIPENTAKNTGFAKKNTGIILGILQYFFQYFSIFFNYDTEDVPVFFHNWKYWFSVFF